MQPKVFLCTIKRDEKKLSREIVLLPDEKLAQYYLKQNNPEANIEIKPYDRLNGRQHLLLGAVRTFTYWRHGEKQVVPLLDDCGRVHDGNLNIFLKEIEPLLVDPQETLDAHAARERAKCRNQAAKNFRGLVPAPW